MRLKTLNLDMILAQRNIPARFIQLTKTFYYVTIDNHSNRITCIIYLLIYFIKTLNCGSFSVRVIIEYEHFYKSLINSFNCTDISTTLSRMTIRPTECD